MMEQFSPPIRKTLALGLLTLALLIALTEILLPSLAAMGTALERLDEARFRHDRLRAIDEGPMPVTGMRVPDGSIVIAADRETANLALMQIIQGAAAASGATVQRAVPVTTPASGGGVYVDVAIGGPEAAVIAAIDRLERGRPVIRFSRWHLARSSQAGGGVVLEGQARAIWRAR